MARRTVLAAALASAVVLSACGGGGAGSAPPTRPATTTQSPPTSTVNGGGGQAGSVAVAAPAPGVPTIYTVGPPNSTTLSSWNEQPSAVSSVVAAEHAASGVAMSRDGSVVYVVTTDSISSCYACGVQTSHSLNSYDPQTLAQRSSVKFVSYDNNYVIHLYAGGDGKLYTMRSNVLYQIDPTNPAATRDTGAQLGADQHTFLYGQDVALSNDGSRAYLNLNGNADQGTMSEIVAIDTTTMQQVWESKAPARDGYHTSLGSVAQRDTGIVVANFGTEIFAAAAGNLVVLSTNGAVRGTVPIDDQASPALLDVPGAAGCNGDGIYVAEPDSGRIAIVDSAALRVTRTIATGISDPRSLALTPDGKLVVGGNHQLAVFASALNPTTPSVVDAPDGVDQIATRATP